MRYSRDPEENAMFAIIRRDIMRENRCLSVSCVNPTGENCVCWQEFREAIASKEGTR